LAVLFVAGAGAAFSLSAPPERAAAAPKVSTTVPSFRPAPSPPEAILARLPVTEDALELDIYVPSDITSPHRVAAPGLESAEALARFDEPTAWSSEKLAGRLYEIVDPGPEVGSSVTGPLRVEYTLDAELTHQVFKVLRQGRVKLGHVILLEPDTGRILTYASTDIEKFPPTRAYPAASLVKVITAATALTRDRQKASLPCRYRGSPYRLTPSRVDPPSSGNTVSLQRALATSNNQCFAQLAVHAVGRPALEQAISAFGWLKAPAPAHAAGRIEDGDDRYDLGRLGCGLAGCRITPLHAAQLAGVLARGERIAPRWIERVIDERGRELPIPSRAAPVRVISLDLATELRAMLVETTQRGTARSAFRKRHGKPLLGPVKVAGKTGSLSGVNPKGRYEWFIGVAPAEQPRVAIAVLLVQSDLWWRSASQIASEVLSRVFCERGKCSAEGVERWVHTTPEPARNAVRVEVPRQPGPGRSPVFVSASGD
jgi:hypothetical protein